MGTAFPVVPSSAGAACTIADIVNPFLRCQCHPAIPHALPHSVFRAGLCGRCPYQAHSVQEEKEAVMTAGGDTMETGVPCAFGGDTQFNCKLGFPPQGLVCHQFSISKWQLNATPNVKRSGGKVVSNMVGSVSGVGWVPDFRCSLHKECKYLITILYT